MVKTVDAEFTNGTLPKKRIVKRRKKKQAVDDEYEQDQKMMKQQLQEKFAGTSKKKSNAEHSVLKVKQSKMKVLNPEQHDSTIERTEEIQISKNYQIEFSADVVPTHWVCAVCHHRSSRGSLGDLFGPYNVRITNTTHWPSWIVKKEKKNNDEVWIDAWLHGECALWIPEVHMQGSELVNLEVQINKYWAKNCHLCHKPGATIAVDNDHVHYPCALRAKYDLNESLLICTKGPHALGKINLNDIAPEIS